MGEVSIRDGKDFYDEGYDDDDRSINNRITFSREKFYGRQDELVTLHGLYTRLRSQRNLPSSEETLAAAESPVVIISGYSGAGKSCLVERFIAELDQRRQEGSAASNFLFLSSKFEELQTPDPLSVISHAFKGLCQFLQQDSQKAVLDRLRASIETSLGAEANALASIIPDINEILGRTETSPLTSSRPSDSGWNRLQYLFQKLLKALCHEDCPLLMFLDDLQWADSASISLLGALLKDSSLKNFMFIGAMRGEEVDHDHPIFKLMADTEKATGKTIERIELLNLSIRDVSRFIADTLNLESDECELLTEFVYGKTRGNIFYAMQMLEELDRLHLLYYSMISFRWEWNLVGVEVNAGLSENLDDAVAGKIQHAPEKMQKALILASYTRSSFDVRVLHILMGADGCDLKQEELVRLLDMAVLEGFLINSVGSWTYRFAHDRIQQAAYSLVKSGSTRDDLRRMIGSQLFDLVENDKGEDWMLFVAADHLNSCSIHGGDSQTLVRLNLLCGEKANIVAAYVPASMYLQLAMKNLRKSRDHWLSQYDLSLRLFRALCDVELCLGNFAAGDQLAREVIDNAQNLQDRLPTFLSLAMAKGRQEKHAEAYEICLRALLDLNAVSPHNHTLHILKDNHIVRRKLKKYSDYDILLLPQLTNERKRYIARFLAEGQLRAYYCGDMVEFMFCCLKSIRITFKYGLSATSAHAFASYGLLLDSMRGDYAGALRMAALARQILARVENTVDSKAHKALTLTTVSFYIEAWSSPREQILSTGHLAHEAGMESGNVDIGFLSWIIAHNFAYGTGYPLGAVEKTGREILQQLQLYSAESILSIFVQMRLPVRHLLGQEQNELDWERLADFDTITGDKKSETYRSSFGYLGRLELAVYYGKLELALAFSTSLKPYMAHEAMYVIIVKNLFYTGLAYSGLARKGGAMAARYRSKASALCKEVEKICRTKGLSPLHKSLIMKADFLACRSKDMLKIASAYDNGISAAVKMGFLQDAALASEIAGEFFFSMSDHDRARQFFCQAYDIYHEWGAMAKVKDLSERRSTYFDSSIQDNTTTTNSCVHPTWVSAELSGSQNAVDLELLSRPIPRTELPDMSIAASGRATLRDRDEISILTDPSVERAGTQNSNS